MATNATQEAFLNGSAGKYLDPDGVYRYQCVDVAVAYAAAIFPGVSWETSFGRNNANGHFPKDNGYWTSIRNIDGDLSSVPMRGDVIIWGGDAYNPYGHIAVVLAADAYSVTVLQQNADGSGNLPTQIATLPYNAPGTGPAVGWLRPKVSLVSAPNQRVAGNYVVNQRAAARSDAAVVRQIPANGLEQWDGYVHGETVTAADGTSSDIWYKDSQGYASAIFFDPFTTEGLPDLTPKAAEAKLAPNQRKATGGAVNQRREAATGAPVVRTIPAGSVEVWDGYVHGALVDLGNGVKSDIWYKDSLGYASALFFDPVTTDGLKDLTPKAPTLEKPAPAPAPAPAQVLPQANAGRPVYTFDKAFDLVSEVRPAHPDNFLADGMPATVTGLVIHQFIAGPTRFDVHLDSVINAFTHNDRIASAHFGVEGKRVVQFVDLKDRAYHAGPGGNDSWSIEVYGGMDAETLATVALLVHELEKLAGRELDLRRHKEIMATQCGEDVDLDGIRRRVLALAAPVPAPAPAPTPEATLPASPAAPSAPDLQALRAELVKFAEWRIDSYLKGL